MHGARGSLRGECVVPGGVCMVLGDVCGAGEGGLCGAGGGGMHGAGGVCGARVCVWCWGACVVPGGVRGVGACVVLGGAGGVRGIRRDTVNERAVRILLECILVRSLGF